MQVLRIGERIGEQRIAVGRGPRHIGDADGAVAAGLVLDDDVLADLLLHHRREHARRHVGQPARRKRHDDGDGAVRIILRLRARASVMPASSAPIRGRPIAANVRHRSLPLVLNALHDACQNASAEGPAQCELQVRHRPGLPPAHPAMRSCRDLERDRRE